ncbi:C40 family peptidase [Actinomadura flavalba]|uniref:C40 family peptidase n=1 Tax=Actinomadura flavalba TaxID=1120938 RepID=UPI000378BF9B|nr:NlpC/P60 family protein [Actinomadura flavalba]
MADRTVTARLRLDVDEYIRNTRRAQAETRRLAEEAERLGPRATRAQQQMRQEVERSNRAYNEQGDTARHSGGEVERAARRAGDAQRDAADETERQADANEEAAESSERAAAGMMEIASAGGAAGAAIASAGVAVGAFGLVAAPSIGKVITASQDLAAEWSGLSRQQQVVALGVNNLGDEYKALARSYEPQAMSAFNSVLAVGGVLLPKVGKLVDETGDDVGRFVDRIGTWASGPEVSSFLDWSGRAAPAALDELGTAATTTGSLALRLVQDIEPVGMSMLGIVNGGLAAVNALAQVNPAFAQLGLLTLMLRRPLTSAAAGVGTMVGRMGQGAGAAAGMSRSTRALNLATKAGPALFVAAGVGLAFWAVRASQASSSTEKLIGAMRIEARATGNNLEGHRKFAAQLDANARGAMARLIHTQNNMSQAVRDSQFSTTEHSRAIGVLRKEYRETESALKDQREIIKTVETGADLLARKYGVTQQQALSLATAAGVDLTNALDKNGKLTAQAAAKIGNYRINVEAAKDPTRAVSLALDDASNSALSMKDRMTALATAADSYLTPALNAFNATTQLRRGFRDLAGELGKAKGDMSGNTESSNALRSAFTQQITTVQQLRDAMAAKTGNMAQANAAASQYIPILMAMAGRNRDARDAVERLAIILGTSTAQTRTNRDAFVRQATAMLGSRTQAIALWTQYQRLTTAQNTGTASLGGYISRVRTSAEAARQMQIRTGQGATSQQAYNARVRDALPVLYSLAGRNSFARAQVDALARATGNASARTRTSRTEFLNAAAAMGVARGRAENLWREYNKLPAATRNAAGGMQSFKVTTLKALKEIGNSNPRVSVNVSARGTFRRSTTAGLNRGGPVPWLAGAAPERDSVPAMLTPDEHVWTTAEVRRAGGHDAVQRLRAAALRGELAGYATGGAVQIGVTGNRAAGAQRSRWARDQHVVVWREHRATYDQAAALAEAWKKLAGGGGPVVAAARTQLGVPYVWGGTSWGRGLDCSGLTQGAWRHGAGKEITRTTYTQFPNSRPISGPRPGALGFPHMGHVVLASRPGYIIEAPRTGLDVREVPASRGYQWRWPKAAGYAKGGAVQRLGDDFVDGYVTGREIALAKLAGVAGDPGPGGIPGYAGGGWVRGRPGKDRNLIKATAGEFIVARSRAKAVPQLVEAINSGRVVGEEIVRPRLAPAPLVRGGDGASLAPGRSGAPVIHLCNHGVIASRIEAEHWLAKGYANLRSQGRVP